MTRYIYALILTGISSIAQAAPSQALKSDPSKPPVTVEILPDCQGEWVLVLVPDHTGTTGTWQCAKLRDNGKPSDGD